jgi:PAS domain S-box-containing protein
MRRVLHGRPRTELTQPGARLPVWEAPQHSASAWRENIGSLLVIVEGRSSTGRARRVVGVNIDVTERKRTELALQASEAIFAGILAIAGDAIVSIDANQRITPFNDAAERLFGYSRDEILEQPIDLLIPARFRPAHQQHVQHFTTGPDIPRRMAEQQEVAGRRKNGEEFYTVVLRDITERKRRRGTPTRIGCRARPSRQKHARDG